MPVSHSPEIHARLLARIPDTTGYELHEWFDILERGPALTNCLERAHWLADEYGLTHGYATAIVQEFDRRRRSHTPVPQPRS
ncbi:DUF4287 domain-containing protein [Thermobifida alba]|jgi:hypothetical protein|uniref:DUF4287 domain-containing protein n=1 Tax=Thermobifida alba TaxID=53522 RepID=A0ABY4L5G2_THEAE|nr:DUF4287 domain-containing protein [Thermobifida alba]UPT22935.1 DUF4287 domain-containing protein [Thermobifida alba]